MEPELASSFCRLNKIFRLDDRSCSCVLKIVDTKTAKKVDTSAQKTTVPIRMFLVEKGRVIAPTITARD